MSTEVTPYINASLDEKRRYVQTLANAGDLLPKGLWENVKDPQTNLMVQRPSAGKILLVAETGAMLGLHPMAALQGIDVIEGNPTLKPALMQALIRKAGHKLRIVETGTVEGGDLAVTTTITRSDDPDFPYVYTWTPFNALRAELIDSYSPDSDGVWHVKALDRNSKSLPWQKWTPRMCRWRSLGDAASAACEDVLMGLHYTPEELGAVVDDAGEMVQVANSAPSEDWAALFKLTTSKVDLTALIKRATAAGEYTDAVRTVALTHLGMFNRAPEPPAEPPAEPAAEPATEPAPEMPDSNIVDADVVEDEPAAPAAEEPREMTEEEYERHSAAEFDAANHW